MASPAKKRLAEEDVLLLTDPLPDPIWQAAPDEEGQIWPPARIKAAEMIWGLDCLGPGNIDYSLHLASSFTLTPMAGFIEMNAGLGGATRAFVKNFGVWVTALERHAALATEGQNRSIAADMEKKAQIVHYPHDELQFKPRSFEFILAKDAFWFIKDKEKLYSSIAKILKDHAGQLVFTDYIKIKVRRDTGSYKKWTDLYPDQIYVNSHEEVLDFLYRNRLNAQADDDVSNVYRGFVVEAWQNLARSLAEQSQPDKAVLRHIAREAERWTRFVAAIDAGELKVYRFHITK